MWFEIYFTLLISWIVFIYGFEKKEYAITMLGSVLLSIWGIFVWINGLNGNMNLLTQSFAIVHFFIGIYFMIMGNIPVIKKQFAKNKPREVKNEEVKTTDGRRRR